MARTNKHDGWLPLSLSFNKQQRLLKPQQYQRVFDSVNVKQGGTYFTFLSRDSDDGNCKIGLIISKRHLPKAVARNQVKRCIRESFRLRQIDIQKVSPPFDLIVLSKPNTAKLDKRALKKELDQQWSRFLNKRSAL